MTRKREPGRAVPGDAPRPTWGHALRAAFDEVRFGPERTLNLRTPMPTGDQAAERLEKWLREKQVAKAGEVLVVTGRGKGSIGGVPVVRMAVLQRLASLRRRNVVKDVAEHTEGSFVVTLAPVSALLETPRRRREPPPPRPNPLSLEGLDDETRDLLRALAEHALDALGVHERRAPFVEDEMVRQFQRLAPSVGEGAGRETRLRAALRAALDEVDER